MNNPFKKITQSKELPTSIKKKVFEDIEMIKLSLDLADLFTVKYPDSIEEFLKLIKSPNKN
ncbi:hypothetical protein [Aquimarina sediminis]|uniref:hypothetical protein n=1 Tax=Aquimarina sediminis TaxID=2070536 RepID=UPI000CA065E7|nr:hypothetical protein [Aquimarina sediminis]